GAVVAVAFFDLIPESVALGQPFHSAGTLLSWVGVGFLSYLVLDRVQLLRRNGGPGHSHAGEHAPRGALGRASLSLHSFLDGIVIGFAFQASDSVGAVVTMAVLTHDFSDGLNT